MTLNNSMELQSTGLYNLNAKDLSEKREKRIKKKFVVCSLLYSMAIAFFFTFYRTYFLSTSNCINFK